MNSPLLIKFGNGDKVVNYGTYGNEHCVFISDARYPGVVGECAERENLSNEELGDNPIVIITKSEKRARLLCDVICGKLDNYSE